MTIRIIDKEGACRLVFDGCLTAEFSRELEDRIIEALRRYTRFEVDLSGVKEVDQCGLHLLHILNTLGGSHVETVADSPVVVEASREWYPPQHAGAWYGRCHAEYAQAA
ncbi:MAG TPA: hypothetical protein VFF03_17120 [Rhodocyclaceae bacterium]|nr:hypothetical protein [Rhodocyclaceae bacterium]